MYIGEQKVHALNSSLRGKNQKVLLWTKSMCALYNMCVINA